MNILMGFIRLNRKSSKQRKDNNLNGCSDSYCQVPVLSSEHHIKTLMY